jgi:hypothetical protein
MKNTLTIVVDGMNQGTKAFLTLLILISTLVVVLKILLGKGMIP